MQELLNLLNLRSDDCSPWVQGRIPKHYKRVNVSRSELLRLGRLGAAKFIAAYPETSLYFTQSVLAGALLSGDYDKIYVITPSQYGKAIEKDCPVLTRSGWKTHGELTVGDYVIGLDGEWKKVTYVHPDCVMDRKVTFSDGTSIKCHHNHTWVAAHRNYRKWREIPTDEMVDHFVPYVSSVRGDEKELKVDPYVLGVWLGDGSTTKGQVCSSKEDISVLDKCRETYPDGAEWVHKDTGVVTRSFIGLAHDLSSYNMCYQRKDTPEKEIPVEYLTADYESRLKLLAGLIDTDGYLFEKEGRYYFTTAGEKLRDSFETLVHSFGWSTSTIINRARMSSSGIEGKKDYYRIGFTPDVEIPCVLERKRNKCKKGRYNYKKVVSVEKLYDGTVGNCITVEGGVYCIGKHLIPTHNSWLMGHVGLLLAYNGMPVYIAGAAGNTSDIIMRNVDRALMDIDDGIKADITNLTKSQIERLNRSLSKDRKSFKSGGFVEAVSLGETYSGDTASNKAVGRGGMYIVDEAALLSEDTLIELGRAEFARTDGKNYPILMISNPHKPGYFYDHMIEENPGPRTLIIWMDALTAVEEGRWTVDKVVNSDFAKNTSRRRVYLMCELDTVGDSMFTKAIVHPIKTNEYTQYFLGVDAAYRGKDNIQISLISLSDTGEIGVKETKEVKKGEWIDGVTSEDIIRDVAAVARYYGCPLVCVDIGFGVWLVEGLVKRGINAIGINFGGGVTRERLRSRHYAATNGTNLRAEMHLDLQSLMDDGKIVFEKEAYDQIKDVLPFVTAERKASGKIQIRPKSEIKVLLGHSPDALDSILLGIHAVILFCGESLGYIV